MKSVYCLELDCHFETLTDAERQTGILRQNIGQCCRGSQKFAGKHPVTGEKLQWMYVDDFNDVDKFFQWCKQHIKYSKERRVRCFELRKTFGSAKEASEKTGIKKCDIYKCCDKITYTAGKHPVTGIPLTWCYMD